MNYFASLCLTIAVIAVPMGAWATSSLTLSDCIDIALANNPEIDVVRQQYSGNEGLLTQARAGYLPQLSADAGYGRYHVQDLQPVDEDNVGLGRIRLSQLIVDFGKTTGLIDNRKFTLTASEEALTQAYQDVVFQVKRDFFQVLASKRFIVVAEEAVRNYEQQLYRARRFFEAGIRARIDVTNAEVVLSNQRLALLRAEADLRSSKVALEQTLGTIPNNGDYEIVTDDPPLAKLAAQKPELPVPLAELLDSAAENRPGLKQFNLLVDAAQANITRARGGYWPSIDAVGDYTGYDTDLTSLTDTWEVRVGLTWELFTGFRTQGEVAEAQAGLREARASLRTFELEVTQDVTDSFLRAEENQEAVDIADQTLELAEENLRLADGRYTAGIGDILEFNDAQLLYIENQNTLVDTYYTYLTSLARLERATGVVPELETRPVDLAGGYQSE
jgi:outer membrane protein